MFVLYRYLYDRLGVSQIGIWSLVMAATAVSRIGELGLSAGVVRFVAKAIGAGDRQRAADVVQTVAITLAVVFGIFFFLGEPLLRLVLPYLLPSVSLPVALKILPIALGSLWLMIVVSVVSGSLDGCFRTDLRCFLTAGSQLGYLIGCLLLVPKMGLVGVAWAQLIQYGLLLVALWIALRRQLSELPLIPLRWRVSVLSEVFWYGVRFQVISIVGIFFDPLIKIIMSRIGGLDALGYYTMANALILNCRAVIVEAARVMVPTIANLKDSQGDQARDLFLKAYEINFYIAILFYSLLGIFSSSICILLLGHRQDEFILFALILNIGWFVNTIITPAYFSNLGSGRLNDNMVCHVIMSVISVASCSLMGLHWGGTGVVTGVTFGLLGGGVFLLITHIRHLSLDSLFVIPRGLLRLLIAGVVFALAANYLVGAEVGLSQNILIACVFSLCFFLLVLKHPSKSVLIKLVIR